MMESLQQELTHLSHILVVEEVDLVKHWVKSTNTTKGSKLETRKKDKSQIYFIRTQFLEPDHLNK